MIPLTGTTNFVFTVTLTGAQNSCLSVTVAYATANDTALSGSDYTATSGTLTFNVPHASNSITQTITVPVTGETTVEANETFFVNLSGATNATISDNQGLGTITNEDTCPLTLIVNDAGDAVDATPGNGVCETATGNGVCTLRAAIMEANARTDCANVIEFALGAGTPTIMPLSPLPDITDPVTINGNTGLSTRVELDGTMAGSTPGLRILAGNSTIAGLVINRFDGYGILIQTNGGNTIKNCYIGTDVTGALALGNGDDGVRVAAANNLIGGTTDAERNVISGNKSTGVEFASTASGNQVSGNYIGVNAAGTAALGNGSNGIILSSAPNNTIGGTTDAERNVISGNVNYGVFIANAGASGNKVIGNYIGTDKNGTARVGNTADGVILAGAPNNTVERNVISGNDRIGVQINGGAASGNKIIGNIIGRNATDTANLGNGRDGVFITNAPNNTIGGTTPADRNLIAGNGSDGVEIGETTATGNAILGNSIFNNTNLGIDLSGNGVTANDAGDSDTGPNNLQNFPVLTCVTSAGGATTIGGTLNSLATTAFRIEYFVNDSCDASGNGEGQTLLGTQNVTTDASGNVTLNATGLPPIAVGKFITATATRLDAMDNPVETSEFSACLAVSAPPTLAINDVTLAEGNVGTTNMVFTVTLTGAQTNCLPVTVAYATANDTATAGSDYTTTSGTLTFNSPHASNSVTQTITVPVMGETAVEPNETFFVNLSSATNATISDNQGLGTISNDDSCPTQFTVNDLGDAADPTPGDYLCATTGGGCTLRAAIMEANAIGATCSPLTINITATGVITLGSALPAITHPNLTITGPGASSLTVSGAMLYRPFTINSGKTVAISGLTVANGFNAVQAGGIQNSGTLTMTDMHITGNRSPQSGGIQNDSVLNLSNSSVTNNVATIFGGGLNAAGTGTTTLSNCTFTGNRGTGDTGAIGAGGTSLSITSCTISGNTVVNTFGVGAGITTNGVPTTLRNTIVIGNTQGSGLASNIDGTVQAASAFNVLGTGPAGGLTNGVNNNQVGVTIAAASLGSLANYGGLTPTVPLLPGSVAINAGDNASAPATDQRGIARPQQSTVDIGAYESRGFTLALNGGTPQSTTINTAFGTALKVNVTPNSAGEPVDGGQVTFTPPGSGATAALATSPATIASGMASVTATANATAGGPYNVIANALGVTTPVNFALTNSCQPPTTANAGPDQTLCSTSATLAANTPTFGTGAWSIVLGTGGSVTTPSSPTSAFTGVAGTTYTLRWTISNVPCTASTDDVVITLTANPTAANAGPDQTVCGTSATLAGNTPSVGTGAWSIVSGAGGSVTTPASPTSAFTGVAGTTYTLRWTISNSPCTASTNDVVITLRANPTVANAGPDQTLCATSATLAANTPTVGTGSWSIVSGTGGTVTTPSSPTSAFTGTAGTTYTLRWTISNAPCTASTNDVVITLTANPTTANAGPDQTLCATSTTLAANTPTVGTGSWSIISGVGGSVTTPSSPTSGFTGVMGTAYTLRWTISNAPCTASADDVIITFTANNTVGAASSSPTLCISTPLTAITHATTGATGIGTATGLPAGVTAAFAGNTITISGTPTAAGVFNYTIPVTGGCGTANATGTITVTANNTVAAASASPTLCINTALTAITHVTTGATGIGAAMGLPAGVTAAFAANTITISGTPTAAGVFNYTIPVTGGCGTANATGTITVTANQTVAAASASPTLCINSPLTAITHATTGATGIGAVTGLPAGVTAAFASNTITISGTPTAAGVFTYSIPVMGGCGTASATGTITVTANQTVAAASASPTLCINSPLTAITHATTGATGIGAAMGLPAGVTAAFAGNTITISGTPTAAGVFTYSIPVTGGCGTANATGTITVTANQTVAGASASPTLCINTVLTAITHATTGATGIGAATGLPAGVTAAFAANTITISGTPTAAGVFNYTIPVTGGCGTANATGTITVNATVTATALSDATVCEGTTATFTTTAGGAGPFTYVWKKGATVLASATNTLTLNNVQLADAGSYSVEVTGACGAVTQTATLTVYGKPVATVGAAQTICPTATTAALGGNTPPNATAGAWTSNSGGTFSSTTDPNATWTAPAGFTGVATLTWTVSNTVLPLCSQPQTATVAVTVRALPTVSISDATVAEGNSGQTAATFNVTLSAANSCNAVTVSYATADGTANAGSDYVATSGTLTFAVGETSKTVTVQVNGDTTPEPHETFLVNLSNPVNATLAQVRGNNAQAGNQGIGTITNDDLDLIRAELSDPLNCVGAGDVVSGLIQLTNPNATTQGFTLTTAFTNLVGLPGTCTVTGAQAGAVCTVTATGLTASGMADSNAVVSFQFQGQIADAVNGGAVTTNSTGTVGTATANPVIATLTANCPQAGPGLLPNGQNAVSDQKPGSVLVYPLYSSSAANASTQNTRFSITNTNMTRNAYVHLFFVDGSSCSVADSYICLTPNQTAAILASDVDPGTTGYIVAVAVNTAGCPINFNHLIGDEFVKLASGHQSNLGAESIAAVAGGLTACNPLTDSNAMLAFNNVSYNALPRVLASSNIPSRGDSNDTYVVINRIGGNLSSNASTIGGLFGILYDDAEAAYSFSLGASACQSTGSITNDRPRVVPRFETVIPSGRSGWFKIWGASDIGILGSQINRNANATTNAAAFNHGHNLHKLTLTTTAALTIPVFPPSC